MTPRDLLELVRSDHQFTVTSSMQYGPALIQETRDQQIVTLSCSCHWDTKLALLRDKSTPEASIQDKIVLWSRSEQLDHLLDQETELRSVLDLLQEQGLSVGEVVAWTWRQRLEQKT